ncbi:MAG: phosphate ABC transporter substrate-binding protein [Solirubrobacteraceae bacterium]
MHRNRLVALCCVAGVMAAVPASASAVPTITASGSTSVYPLFTKLARQYLKFSHHKVKFRAAQGGSDIGVADVAAGRVTVGNSSRDPKPTDPGGLVFNKIARDAICLTTNPGNHLANLSQAAVVGIFSGAIRDWSNVPGSNIKGPIDLVTRTAASGTHDAFQKIIMGSTNVSTTASEQASNGLVQQKVSSDPQAIGYVSLAFVGSNNPVGYAGVSCTLQNAKSGQYGAVRNFYMVTRGNPSAPVQKFINWTLHNKSAQKITASEWVPLF